MNGRRRLLAASVISIQNSSFVYPSCQNCFSKLILDSNRFNCLKCGCMGEAKDANYRYKLSLKVADTNDLYDITVFGSSLDPFFGVTAGGLRRCIQNFNQASGELDRDASPSVLIEAVRTCFIGRKFIFGVKNSEKHDGKHSISDSILQNCSRMNRWTRDLTACQIFLPDPAFVGFTVISFFHQFLQSANFRSGPSSSQQPDSSLIAVDQPSNELSSLCSASKTVCFVQSGDRESFSGPWQQSFGLTSSSVDWVTREDFSALVLGKIAGEQCKLQERSFFAEPHSLNPSNKTIQDLQLCSSVSERNEQEDNEFSSMPSQSDTITAPEKVESFSSLKREWSLDRKSSSWLQSPLDLEVKYPCPEITSRHDSFPEKSWNFLLCQRKNNSFCSSIASPNRGNAAGTSRDDPMIWDELPFSESLNEFIARLENESTISPVGPNAHKHSLCETRELNENLSKTSCKQGIVIGDRQAVCTTERFPQLTENVSTCKERSLSCQSKLTPEGGKVSQRESLYRVLPTNTMGGREFDFKPNSPLPLWSLSSTVRAKAALSEGTLLQPEEANVISNNADSFSDLKCTITHTESLYLQRREKPTVLHSLYGGCVDSWENKENCTYSPVPRTGLTTSRELDCDSAAPFQAKNMCKRELKPLTEVQENTFRAIKQNELLHNSSIHPRDNYNVSADLFDASSREIETMVEFSNKSHNSSAPEDVLPEKYTASDLVLTPLAVGYSCSECRLFPSLPPLLSKHSTPITYSLYDSELDLIDTRDFVPYSQSTPVAGPLQKFRTQRRREFRENRLTSKSPTKIHCKCKESRPAFKNTLLRQLTSKFTKHKRASNTRTTAINKSVSQQSFINSELPENDSEEWIPPSATKSLQPVAFSNLKTVGLQARRSAVHKPFDKKPVSQNKANGGKPRTDTCLRSRKLNPMNRTGIPTTPLSANAAKTLLLKDAALGTCACPEAKNSHSPVTYLVGGLDEAATWSPELFTEKYCF
uniref:DNA damage induced apoptosis suppressor n=1 Tax=Pelusios castaneus TaxID=367368 RepID=A0A8C8RUK0_9SAUR